MSPMRTKRKRYNDPNSIYDADGKNKNVLNLNAPLVHKDMVKLEDVYAVLEDSELYDILPGNGADDFIIAFLRKKFAALQSTELLVKETIK